MRDGEPYELSDGQLIECPPVTRELEEMRKLGALVLAPDPAVQTIGFDVGHALDERTLRVPDLSVGGDWSDCEGGWAVKAPALAVEYVTESDDEADLQTKIRQLLAAGTHFVWVVRLRGPRRVEVYETGCPVQTKLPGERLEAPGILKNPPLVEALYDRKASFEHALQTLLERKGYAGLDAVRAEAAREGREEGLRESEARGEASGEARGRAEGLRAAVLDLCEAFDLVPTEAQRAALGAMGVGELEALRAALKATKRWPG